MRNGNYTAIAFSIIIHLLILAIIVLTQSTAKPPFKAVKNKQPIKSFLYKKPKPVVPVAKEITDITPVEQQAKLEKPQPTKKVLNKSVKDAVQPNEAATEVKNENAKIHQQETISLPPPVAKTVPNQPPKKPVKKLDSFTQLQRLRSKLNSRATIAPSNNPYQSYQPPSAFNTNPQTVPHSLPLKDEAQEREKNTKNMGSGIAIAKGEDGTCSITQDMTVYGLDHGSSTQYFSCGESKFDKSFREHMKKVKAKLGK